MRNIHCKSKKMLIGTNYEIIDKDKNQSIGVYADDYFFKETDARIDNNKILFKKQGDFSRKYDILKQDDNAYKFNNIGVLEFNFWKTNAIITINENIYNYKLTNLVNTNYAITDNKNNIVIEGNCTYINHIIKVNFSSENDSEKLISDILILSCLKIYKNFYYLFLFLMILIIQNIAFFK